MSDFKLTQTCLKDLEKEETCPKRFYEQWVLKSFSSPETEAMRKGKFFEYLALGADAGKDDPVTDLRKEPGKGKKLTDQVRLEQQAERFRRMFTKGDKLWIGHEIVETQVKMTAARTEGTMDFVTIFREHTDHSNPDDVVGQKYLWDLKSTKDIESNPKFNPFSWADATQVDYTQQVYYKLLYRATKSEDLPCKVVIFDYTPEMRAKIIDINITEDAERSLVDRIDDALDTIESLDEDVPVLPSYNECMKCKVKGCGSRITQNHIYRETVSI